MGWYNKYKQCKASKVEWWKKDDEELLPVVWHQEGGIGLHQKMKRRKIATVFYSLNSTVKLGNCE